MIYVFISFLCLLVFISYIKNVIILRPNVIILILLVAAVLVGINSDRYDYPNYLEIFESQPVIGDSGFYDYVSSIHTEIGYNVFQGIIKTVYNSATLFFIIFAFISLRIRYKFYKSLISLKDIGIVILAFFAHEFLKKDCIQIRNGFASAIVLYSIIFAYRGQKKISTILIFLASSFHTTALLALPILFFKKDASEKYQKFLIASLVIFGLGSLIGIFNFVFKIFDANQTAMLYLNWELYNNAMPIHHPILLKQLVIVIWILWNREKFFSDNLIFFLFQIYFLSTVYFLLFRNVEIFATRFGSLLYAVEAPLLVLIINRTNKNIQLKKIMLCFFYIIIFLFNIIKMQPMLGWKVEFN